jgi:hypothetical protein
MAQERCQTVKEPLPTGERAQVPLSIGICDFLDGSSAMICARSSSVNAPHLAISRKVRWHPRQSWDFPSTTHTFTQGVAIGFGGALAVIGPM